MVPGQEAGRGVSPQLPRCELEQAGGSHAVRQEAELGRYLALELAQDGHGLTPQTEAARTMDSTHAWCLDPSQTFIPRLANPACQLTLYLFESLCKPPS